MSFSVYTFIPFSDRSAAVTPSPAVSVPEKEPSYISPAPQEGLFAFIRAIEILCFRQSESATSAPLAYSAVTSTPSRRTTFSPFPFCGDSRRRQSALLFGADRDENIFFFQPFDDLSAHREAFSVIAAGLAEKAQADEKMLLSHIAPHFFSTR